MISVNIVDKYSLIAFWLSFIRWITTLYQLPLFDNTGIPEVLKVLFSLVICYAFFPYVKPYVIQDMSYWGENNFWVLTFAYTIIGISLGFLIKLFMSAFIIAGSLITQNIGLSAARYFDPNYQSVGPFEKFIQETMIILIVSSGALIPMFKGVFLSFQKINLHTIFATGMAFEMQWFMELLKSIFMTGLVLASPIVIMQILLSLVMGIVARTIPQMNILMISFIINICFGFILFMIISDEFFHVSFGIYMDFLGKWFQLFTS